MDSDINIPVVNTSSDDLKNGEQILSNAVHADIPDVVKDDSVDREIKAEFNGDKIDDTSKLEEPVVKVGENMLDQETSNDNTISDSDNKPSVEITELKEEIGDETTELKSQIENIQEEDSSDLHELDKKEVNDKNVENTEEQLEPVILDQEDIEEENPIEESKDAEEVTPVKRTRGRPPQFKETKRPDTPARGRGRPKKIKDEDSDEKVEDDEVTPKKTRGLPLKRKTETPPPTRGRGRPKKIMVNAPEDVPEEESD